MTSGDTLGGGVRRGFGVADTSGDGVGVADGVSVGLGVGVAVGVGDGVADSVGVGVGSGVGSGVGDADGSLEGDAVASGVGAGVGSGVDSVGVAAETLTSGDGVNTCTGLVGDTTTGVDFISTPEVGFGWDATPKVGSTGATVRDATGGNVPLADLRGGAEMNDDAANANAPPMSATETIVTTSVPVVRIAPRKTWRGRFANHERCSSRRCRSARTAARICASKSGETAGSGRLRSNSSSRVLPPSSAAHAGQSRTWAASLCDPASSSSSRR